MTKKATKKKATKKEVDEKEETGKEVAEVSNTNVGFVEVDASELDDGIDFAADDYAIPQIGIIQSLSPQRSKTKPEYIEGAQEGDIFDSVQKTLYPGDEGILVIPVLFQKQFPEWAPRDSGGGLVANHGTNRDVWEKAEVGNNGRRFNGDNEIVPTAVYFVLLVHPDGTTSGGILRMSKTQLKHSKRWNSMIGSVKAKTPDGRVGVAPIYQMAYKLTTIPESNNQGEWYRWEITPAGPVSELEGGKHLRDEAKSFRQAVKAGTLKEAEPIQDQDADDEDDDAPM